jgi:hypothetical protein
MDADQAAALRGKLVMNGGINVARTRRLEKDCSQSTKSWVQLRWGEATGYPRLEDNSFRNVRVIADIPVVTGRT